MKSQERVLTISSSSVPTFPASPPGGQKPHSLSLYVQNLNYWYKNLIKKRKPKLYLPAPEGTRERKDCGKVLLKIIGGFGPQVALLFREDFTGSAREGSLGSLHWSL